VKSQRLRRLKEAARAEGWSIDDSPPRLSEREEIDVNSDYFRVRLPLDAEDKEVKTQREDEDYLPLPPEVEERLRMAETEKVTLHGRDITVRPMGEPVPEWDPEKSALVPELVGDEKELEPQLKLFAEFTDRARLKQELLHKWSKFG